MNYPLTLTLAFCTLGAAATGATAQQLQEGHYLVGTQGWDTNDKPDPTKATIQMLSPFTGEASMLRVTGLPTAENPASFFIERPDSFLCGTKVSAAPAEGNLYRVQLQQDKTWKATQLNTSKLGINVSDMAVDGGFVYIIGSAIFGASGDDAKIVKVARADGKVTIHSAFGKKWLKGEALGLGMSLMIIGKTLHAFTFDSTAKTTTSSPHNEHWTISTSTPVQLKKLPDLPLSKRWLDRGYGTRKALLDPRSGHFVVVGAWGELTWRNTSGKDIRQEAFPGKLVFDGSHWSQMWRGVALNSDTYAFGMGDHEGAGLDERRILGGPDKTPFANNVAQAVRPSKGTYTIAGMVYISSSGSYRTIGDGCRDGASGAPSSYASGNPALGNKDFGFTLSTPIQSVSSTTIAVLMVGAKSVQWKLPLIAADCVLCVDPMSAYVLAVAESSKKDIVIPVALPSKTAVTVFTQWFVLSPRANALGAVLSDARELVVR